MLINLDNPEIQSILQNNAIDQHYSTSYTNINKREKTLSEAQEQQRKCIKEKNEDHEYLHTQLQENIIENEALSNNTQDLTIKLNISKDKIVQLKTNMASTIHVQSNVQPNVPTNPHTDTQKERPSVLPVGTSNVEEHSNVSVNVNPNKEILQQDGIHLNDKGISLLAGNLKRAIHIALDIPLPSRRTRSKSPNRSQRGCGRGRRY
ncbi:unnamed protein product [Mytilus coruscus]|uniref:Uncharacterized protein n=1 Tax=Mytilus coruscus TaxID=42192 RepID=A0A6J8EJX0_MYTCO|nr:unnamed protein product [Mytilus coruscus]